MDKDEKKVKTTKNTTPKKKVETKKKEVKSDVKDKKAVAAKSTTTKKVVKPKTVKKEVEVKEEPKVVETEKKVVTKVSEEKISSKELKAIRKKRHIIEAIIIGILAIIVIILLSNRTFLSLKYKTDDVEVSIPRFSYFVSDKDNKVKLMTLRKSDYLKEYYNEYLEGFTFYSCAEGKNTFYYNENTKTLIEEIKVEKSFAVKTIEISYDTRTPEAVCGLE